MNSTVNSGRIVIGLGSGRSGTASLAALIDSQSGGLCFHEMNPSCAIFSGNCQSQINTVGEFRHILSGGSKANLSIDYSRPASVVTYNKLQNMPQVNLLGDIAYYYLSYVEDILKLEPNCKFVCIKRDREQTVGSWLKKSSVKRWPSLWVADRLKALLTRTKFQDEYNYWQEHDGSYWKEDPVWDSCFPKFDASSKEEAIRMYWNYYYQEAGKLEEKYSGSFRIFAIDSLSSHDGQKEILAFIGLAKGEMISSEKVHLHQSG